LIPRLSGINLFEINSDVEEQRIFGILTASWDHGAALGCRNRAELVDLRSRVGSAGRRNVVGRSPALVGFRDAPSTRAD
jgi:hypothetical protein